MHHRSNTPAKALVRDFPASGQGLVATPNSFWMLQPRIFFLFLTVPAVTCSCGLPSLTLCAVAAAAAVAVAAGLYDVAAARTASAVGSVYAPAGAAAADSKQRCSTSPSARHEETLALEIIKCAAAP
jgi:hypothetical protein